MSPKERFRTVRQQVSALLMRYPGRAFLLSLGLLVLVIGFGLYMGRDAEKTVKEGVERKNAQVSFSKRQVKAKDKIIAQREDSIRTQIIYIDRIEYVRDSTLAQLRKKDAVIDSARRELTAPSTDDNPTLEYVAQQLENYRPQAYALPTKDSIR